MIRLLIYAAIGAALLGAVWKFHSWAYQSGWDAREAQALAEAADAANVTTDAVKDAAARNQAATDKAHASGDAASLAAAEEVARLRRELDETRRQLREAYDNDPSADSWRHERLPDSVRRVLAASRDPDSAGAGGSDPVRPDPR